MDFAIPVDHKAKIKENEIMDKYFDIAGELKKLWYMRVTVMSIITGAHRSVS